MVNRSPKTACFTALLLLPFLLIGNARIARAETAEEYFKAGMRMKAAGDCLKAVQYFEYARKADPVHAEACRQTGNCYEKMGDKKKAREAFEACLALRPGDPTISEMLGVKKKEKKKPAARVERKPPMHFGVKLGAGVYTNTVYGDSSFKEFKDVVIGGGAFYSLRLTPRISFQPELTYCQTALFDDQPVTVGGSPALCMRTHKIGYLSLGVPLKGHTWDNGFGGFFMGPALRIKIQDSLTTEKGPAAGEPGAAPRTVKSTGFGMVMGFDLGIADRVGIELRGDYSLNNWIDDEEDRRTVNLMGYLIFRFVN